MPQIPRRESAGHTLGNRYRLTNVLGVGGMGEVWRAHDLELDREIALKLFAPPHSSSPADYEELLARFRQEARAAASLDSPHIVPLHDHGTDEGTPYLVMALVRGQTLAEILAEQVRVPIPDALEWSRQIAAALAVAHAAGIVHRDIKPANAMLDDTGTVKVLDFGIARFLEATLADARLTRTGDLPFGSLAYIAPERFEDAQGDARSDLYALGCVLYELLTGRPPFTGSAASVLRAQLTERPLRPSRLRKEIPEHVDRFVMALLRKDPAERPQTAPEVAESLRVLRDGVPEGLPPLADDLQDSPPDLHDAPSRTDREPEPDPGGAAPRPPRRRLLAVVAAVALVGAGIGIGVPYAQSDEDSAAAPDRASSAPDHWSIAVGLSLQSRPKQLRAIREAVRTANRSGLYPVPIKVIFYPAQEYSDKILKNPTVIATIAGEKDDKLAGVPIKLQDARLATIFPCGDKILPDERTSFDYLTSAGPAAEGAKLAEYLATAKNLTAVGRRVALMGDGDRMDSLADRLTERGVDVSRTNPYTGGAQPQMAAKVLAEKPDAVVVSGVTVNGQKPWSTVFRKAGFTGIGVQYSEEVQSCHYKDPSKAQPQHVEDGWLTTRSAYDPALDRGRTDSGHLGAQPEARLAVNVILQALRVPKVRPGAGTKELRAHVSSRLWSMDARGITEEISLADPEDRPVWLDERRDGAWHQLGELAQLMDAKQKKDAKQRKDAG